MKKSLLFAALFAGVALSCKKNSSGSSGSYHLTATVDGKAKTFNVSPVGTRVAVNGTTYYSVGGLATSSATGETMQIGFNSQPGGPVMKVGSYTDTSSVYDIEGIYQLSLSQMYTAGTALYWGTTGGGSKPITNHFKLTITALDSSSIKGTFSGDYYASSSTDSAKKSITNGDFYVKFF